VPATPRSFGLSCEIISRRPSARLAFTAVLLVASAVVVVGAFGPWVYSGSSARSSFELLDLADRLGFASNGPFGWFVAVWPIMPLLVVASNVAAWAGRATLAGALGATAGGYVIGVAITVARAPATVVRTAWGVPISLIGAVGLLGVSLSLLVVSRATARG
jgi:hypothetical protein